MMHQSRVTYIVFVFICIHSLAVVTSMYKCPIGFSLAYSNTKNTLLCYLLKGPETFDAFYQECNDNLYDLNFYRDFNVPRSSVELWTDYRSTYPGGYLYSWLNDKALEDHIAIDKNGSLNLEEELCLVIDTNQKFTVKNCNKERYRYCVVKLYGSIDDEDDDDGSISMCEDDNYHEFWSPIATCLSKFESPVTREKADDTCKKAKGKILNKGWRYANSQEPKDSIKSWTFPLGLRAVNNVNLYWISGEKIPKSQWQFKHGIPRELVSDGYALVGENWEILDPSVSYTDDDDWEILDPPSIYDSYYCEKAIELATVELSISVDEQHSITLSLSLELEDEYIRCFTDSEYWLPSRLKITELNKTTYNVTRAGDGYYWCKVLNSKSKYTRMSETKRILSINKENSSLVYAVKIRFHESFKGKNIGEKELKLLGTYIYEAQNGSLSSNEWKGSIDQYTIKRKYFDVMTLLLHLTIVPGLHLALPATLTGFDLVYMKSVYYCTEPKLNVTIALGGSMTGSDCRNYTCVGDFNTGVELRSETTTGCEVTTPSSVDRNGDAVNISEAVQQTIDKIDELLNNNTTLIFPKDIDEPFNQINSLLYENEREYIPNQLLHKIENLVNKVKLNDNESISVTAKDKVAIVLTKTSLEAPIRGLKIFGRNPNRFSNEDFQIMNDSISSSSTEKECETIINLPPSMMNSTRRISFVVFHNDRAFQSPSEHTLNGQIISISIENITKFGHKEAIEIKLRPKKSYSKKTPSCVFWKPSKNNVGHWSDDGCWRVESDDGLDTCRCNHLTCFTEILIPGAKFSQLHEEILEYISIVGCSISLIGLFMIGLTAAMFRSWRRNFINKIWLQLCIAIFLLVTSFLTVIVAKFKEYSFICMAVGVVVHFSVLSSTCWMLVAAIISYRRLVIVFHVDFSHKLLKCSLFAWGTPIIIISVLMLIAPGSYAEYYEQNTSSGYFCYPSGLRLSLTVYLPVAVIMIVNSILFVLIIRSLYVNKRISTKIEDTSDSVRCASVSLTLIFLFGLPWYFGLFTSLVSAYLFTLTVTFQGFTLFIFFIVRNKMTRDIWLVKLKIKQSPKGSTTYNTQFSSR